MSPSQTAVINSHKNDFNADQAFRCHFERNSTAVFASTMASKHSSFLIIGGGTFGTATAYSLAQRGYTGITVLDRSAPPSLEAAGNDLNKAVRADYPDALYAKMVTDAIKKWQDPNGLFAGLYSRTGWVLASGKDSAEWIRQCSETAGKLGIERAKDISTSEVKRKWPAFGGSMTDWETFWNPSAGWVNAREALHRMAKAAMNRGVKYVSGPAGHVKHLLFDEHGRCVGAKSRDGSSHYADRIVLAAGAYSAALLNLQGQLVAKGHSVGHIKLTKDEAKKYSDLPLVVHMKGGKQRAVSLLGRDVNIFQDSSSHRKKTISSRSQLCSS